MGDSQADRLDPPLVALLPNVSPPTGNTSLAAGNSASHSSVHSPSSAGHPIVEKPVTENAQVGEGSGLFGNRDRVLHERPERLDQFHLTASDSEASSTSLALKVAQSRTELRSRWYWWPWIFAGSLLDLFSLLILIAIVAAIPLLQFASLGYLLISAARMADRQSWSRCVPGLKKAGRLGRFGLLAATLYLPVLLLIDLSYSAELLQPDSASSFFWRLGAALASAFWLLHVTWAAHRGGKWWQLLWPAPIRFLMEAWRPSTWRRASDQFYDWVVSLQIPRLWWLGARATVAALLWLSIPVSLMIIGQRAQDLQVAPLFGLLGAIGLTWLMFHLPFMQIEFARTNRFLSLFQIQAVRRQYAMAPMVHALALVILCLLAIPLYVLKIEATPADLVWLPSIVFVSLMLPSKLLLGWAMGRATLREERLLPPRRLWLRLLGRTLGLSGVLIYIGALYVAQLVAGQGALVMYFQHIFLAPNPLFAS